MKLRLPLPPDELLEEIDLPLVARSEEMEAFLRAQWIGEGGLFPSEPFAHLQAATVGVLWANTPAPVAGSSGRRFTAGLAEIYAPRPAKRWIMDRQTAFMHQLFGPELPDFILTFDAHWWADEGVTVATKLAVATHELCHCGQMLDENEQPKFITSGERKGAPAWTIVPHDVEQFDLVVAWFGAEAAGVTSMVRAAAAASLLAAIADAFGYELGEVQPFACATCGKAA